MNLSSLRLWPVKNYEATLVIYFNSLLCFLIFHFRVTHYPLSLLVTLCAILCKCLHVSLGISLTFFNGKLLCLTLWYFIYNTYIIHILFHLRTLKYIFLLLPIFWGFKGCTQIGRNSTTEHLQEYIFLPLFFWGFEGCTQIMRNSTPEHLQEIHIFTVTYPFFRGFEGCTQIVRNSAREHLKGKHNM